MDDGHPIRPPSRAGGRSAGAGIGGPPRKKRPGAAGVASSRKSYDDDDDEDDMGGAGARIVRSSRRPGSGRPDSSFGKRATVAKGRRFGAEDEDEDDEDEDEYEDEDEEEEEDYDDEPPRRRGAKGKKGKGRRMVRREGQGLLKDWPRGLGGCRDLVGAMSLKLDRMR